MSEIKALEKLRKSFDDCTTKAGIEPNEFDTVWITKDPAMKMLDEIQAEVDSRFMELPMDADGVPIHVEDIMEGVDKYDTLRYVKGEVIEIGFHATDSEGLVASVALQVWAPDGKSWHRSYIDPYANVYRHVKLRTLEDVLLEFGNRVCNSGHQWGLDAADVVPQFADEIRELLGSDAE